MRSAIRRATVAATAVSAVLLLGACSQAAGSVAASSGATGAATAPSASASAPSGDPGTADSSSAAPVAPTHSARATSAAPATPPVLGTVWASGVQGYGRARPAGLSNNGDPTGIVTGLTWSSWGGASASGTGTAEYVAPGQSVAQGSEERAKVVAFDLGMCNGKPAYRAIEWYFPGKGQHFSATHYFDACTGQDHGM